MRAKNYQDEQKARIAQCILDDVTKTVFRYESDTCISDKVCAHLNVKRPPECTQNSKRRILCGKCREVRQYRGRMAIIDYLVENGDFLKPLYCKHARRDIFLCWIPCGHLQDENTGLCKHHQCVACSTPAWIQKYKRRKLYASMCLFELGIPKDIVRYMIVPLLEPEMTDIGKKTHLLFPGSQCWTEFKAKKNSPSMPGNEVDK